MCTVCGCGEAHQPADTHDCEHGHAHGHRHGPHYHHHGQSPAGIAISGLSPERIIRIEQDILGRNDAHARNNRLFFESRGIFALNLLSSPGSGKTTLLERSITDLKGRFEVSVIEGDQRTENDAERIRATGVPVLQINTGKGCHLDAHMVGHGVEDLKPANDGILFIENVGNLVCPAMFDLGETARVVILSLPEGEDKPLKYPDMFHRADLVLINKIDLLPYLRFDLERCLSYVYQVNPDVETVRVSATTGEGMDRWYAWLERRRQMLLAKRRANRE